MVRVDSISWDEDNEIHATRHGISMNEIDQVFQNTPDYKRNKKGRSADLVAIGRTHGGRRVRVNFVYDPRAREAKPISAWEV